MEGRWLQAIGGTGMTLAILLPFQRWVSSVATPSAHSSALAAWWSIDIEEPSMVAESWPLSA
jgi:hypothetical protein